MRSKNAFKNTLWGIVYEAIVLVCGFIVPRLVLTGFGSEYNGITSVIKQFLQVISLFQAGIGGVTIAALYKPLYERDRWQVSVIIKTTEVYLRKIAIIFIGAFALIAFILPLFVEEFDYFFTASLVLIMSLSTFSQYFFGLTYRYLLSANQHQRIIHIVNSINALANTAMSAILIYLGFSIHIVMLGSALVYFFSPVFIYVYVNKKYSLIKTVKPDNNVIKQRWDNFGSQVAAFITVNTDLIVLSVFSTMKIVSVYTVYNLIISGVLGLFNPFIAGVSAAFGNMIAKNEQVLLKKNIRLYEEVVYVLATFLFGSASAMILFFVELYTKNVSDSYIYSQSIFAYILIAATLFRIYRFPYTGITDAAGHFKQNRNLSFVEAAINIVVSVVLVIILNDYYKLIGVAIGTLFAYSFRTIRFAVYMSKYLIPRSNRLFVKRILLSLLVTVIIASIPTILQFKKPESWLIWVIHAAVVSIIAFVLTLSVELIFYRNDLKELFKMVKYVIKKSKPSSKLLN